MAPATPELATIIAVTGGEDNLLSSVAIVNSPKAIAIISGQYQAGMNKNCLLTGDYCRLAWHRCRTVDGSIGVTPRPEDGQCGIDGYRVVAAATPAASSQPAMPCDGPRLDRPER